MLLAKRAIDSGASERDLWDEHFIIMARSHRALKVYKRLVTPDRDWFTKAIVLWGPSGVGKSRRAREQYPGAYWKPFGKWWDDYDGQETVILDEFTGAFMSFRELLRIFDSSPLSVETKGGTTKFVARTLVFTSNFHPREWYCGPDMPSWDKSPLRRRIDENGEVIHLTGDLDLGLVGVGLGGVSAQYRPPTPERNDEPDGEEDVLGILEGMSTTAFGEGEDFDWNEFGN